MEWKLDRPLTEWDKHLSNRCYTCQRVAGCTGDLL